jgi:hypothetical protein
MLTGGKRDRPFTVKLSEPGLASIENVSIQQT